MTERPAATPFRTLRTLAFTATAGGAALTFAVGGWAPAAMAVGNGGNATSNGGNATSSGAAATAPGQTSASATASATAAATGAGQTALQVRAQELAGEIEADGRNLDELDAAYNAALIRLQSIHVQQTALRAGMAHTSALVAQAQKNLKEQALLAYMSGGAPLISYLPDRPGQDPSLMVSYAEIVAGGEKRAATTYRSDLASLRRESGALASTEQEATVTLAGIRADQAQATTAMAAQRQALAQVKGRMAVLVAQVESAQQQAAARSVQALLASDSGGPTGATTPARYPAPVAPAPGTEAPAAPVTRAVARPAPTPAPVPATAPPATAPPATAGPPPVGPPPTAAPPTAAPATDPPATAPPSTTAPPPSDPSTAAGSIPPQAPGASQALAYAQAQIGKPYQWGGAGPDSFDCSGLVMRAWEQAGIDYPHLAQDQYDMTAREPLSDALPGDLIFFGTPDNVYHVGIYIGNGQMIDAPETGQDVSVQSIYWDTLLGAGRVHS